MEKPGRVPPLDDLRFQIERGELGERLTALGWLASEASPAALDVVAVALGDRNWRVRSLAAELLGETGGDEGRKALLSALADGEFTRRQAAEEGLKKVAESDPAAIVAFLADPEVPAAVKPVLLRVLGAKADNLDDETLGRLQGSDLAELRAATVQILARRTGPSTFLDLLDGLADPSWEVRSRAIRALVESPEPGIATELLRRFDHPLRSVALASVEILAARRDRDLVAPLEKLFRTGSPLARLGALTVLGGYGAEAALEVITLAVQDSDPVIRHKAIDLLVVVSEDQATQVLVGLVRDGQLEVRLDAIRGLARLGSPNAIRQLRTILAGGDWTLKQRTIEALGASGRPEAHEVLVQSLADPDVGAEAARIVAASEDPEIVRTLVAHLGRPGIGPQAVAVLRRMDRGLTIGFLLSGLRSDQAAVQINALEVLGQVGDAELLPILEDLERRHPNPAVRKAAFLATSAVRRRTWVTPEHPAGSPETRDEP